MSQENVEVVVGLQPAPTWFRMGSVLTWTGGLIERAINYLDIDQARVDAERLAQNRG